MANFRQIHVSIWKDEWYLDLDPEEKLLFIYLFSNEATSIAGIYKLAMKVIAFESGLPTKRIKEIMAKFSAAGKVFYEDGVVWMVNMSKYHATKSDKVKTRIASDLALIPDCRLKTAYLEGCNTLSIPYGYGMDTETQLKEKEDNTILTTGAKAPSPFQEKQYELANYFMQITGLEMGGDFKAKQKLWWTPSGEIYKLVGEDTGKAKDLIDRAVARLKGRVTISDMNSIIKTCRAIRGEDNAPDVHNYEVVQ